MFLWLSGLVELHGGKVGVLSQEGQGSTFFFELPLFEVSAPEVLLMEEVYPTSSNVAESTSLVSNFLTETEQNHQHDDIESNSVQQDVIVRNSPRESRWWGRSPKGSRYSFSSLISSSFSSNIPHPIRIEPESDKSGEVLGTPKSPFAPNGVHVAVVSPSRRRRLDQFSRDNMAATAPGDAAAAAAAIDTADFKVDEVGGEGGERPDEKGEDGRVARNEAKKSLRFMIVDDTATTRKLLRRMLTDAGHHVDEAADG
jgi:CheY-like chemotaxis protein